MHSITNYKRKITVILYIHKISHHIKKIAGRAGVWLVFSAPNQLARLCRLVNRDDAKTEKCKKTDVKKFVDCCSDVVYDVLCHISDKQGVVFITASESILAHSELAKEAIWPCTSRHAAITNQILSIALY